MLLEGLQLLMSESERGSEIDMEMSEDDFENQESTSSSVNEQESHATEVWKRYLEALLWGDVGVAEQRLRIVIEVVSGVAALHELGGNDAATKKWEAVSWGVRKAVDDQSQHTFAFPGC